MRLFKSILRQTVDILFFIATLVFFILFMTTDWNDASYWLGACCLYVLGNIFNKARLAIWLEDNT